MVRLKTSFVLTLILAVVAVQFSRPVPLFAASDDYEEEVDTSYTRPEAGFETFDDDFIGNESIDESRISDADRYEKESDPYVEPEVERASSENFRQQDEE